MGHELSTANRIIGAMNNPASGDAGLDDDPAPEVDRGSLTCEQLGRHTVVVADRISDTEIGRECADEHDGVRTPGTRYQSRSAVVSKEIP